MRPNLLRMAVQEKIGDQDMIKAIRAALPVKAQLPFDELLSALKEW